VSARVLITGAGGFVGAYLAEGLAAAGLAVTGFDRRFDAGTRERLAGIDLVEAELTREALDALGGFDLVIHGAAVTTAPSEFGLSDFAHVRHNCDLVLDALDFARSCGARDFVFISSSGVFGAEDSSRVLLETTPAHGKSAYAMAKRAGEIFVEGANGAGLRAIAVRLGPIYGPEEAERDTRRNLSPLRRWIDAGARGEPILVEIPDARRDWTFAPDLPGALLALLARQPAIKGIIHLTSGEAMDDADLALRIARHFGVACELANEPMGPVRVPMSSCRIRPDELYRWTPLQQGLSLMLEGRT
jgi:nucleoside-diphosphate-sugar epimerase